MDITPETTLADDLEQYGPRVARITYVRVENDKALVHHALEKMSAASVVNVDCRSWDIPGLWVCDGSVFPTVGGVNPSLTIQAIAIRTAFRIDELAAAGDL